MLSSFLVEDLVHGDLPFDVEVFIFNVGIKRAEIGSNTRDDRKDQADRKAEEQHCRDAENAEYDEKYFTGLCSPVGFSRYQKFVISLIHKFLRTDP